MMRTTVATQERVKDAFRLSIKSALTIVLFGIKEHVKLIHEVANDLKLKIFITYLTKSLEHAFLFIMIFFLRLAS